MYERSQWLGALKNFYANRYRISREQFEWALVVAKVHAFVTLHTFFPRQALVLGRIDALTRPDERIDVETRTRTDGSTHVVRVLRVNQDYAGCFHGVISIRPQGRQGRKRKLRPTMETQSPE